MANKATREQVLGVVEEFMGKDSATYKECVALFEDGRHPNEVLMHIKSRLNEVKRQNN